MTSRNRILIVEDDVRLADLLKRFLSSEGYQVETYNTGDGACDYILTNQFDILLLDMMLPVMDGIEICAQVRSQFSGIIIMLTAQEEDMIEISALNSGADDYLVKPVRTHVLLARINALLRRTEPSTTTINASVIKIQDLTIEPSNRKVLINQETVDLTDAEYELLYFLATHSGQVMSREDILNSVRGIEYDGLDRSIDMRISKLRKKLHDDKHPYQYIKTIRGQGYLFIKH